MSQPLKNWKASAYASIAEYYKVEAERASFEERLEQAKLACIRQGVSFRFNEPEIRHAHEAYGCNCGAVVTYDYGVPVPATHACAECREKAATAAREDAIAEGRTEPAPAKPISPPERGEEIPF